MTVQRGLAWILAGAVLGSACGSVASQVYFQIHPDLYYAFFMGEVSYFHRPIYPLVVRQGLAEGGAVGLALSV